MTTSGWPCGGKRGPAPVDTGTGYGWVRGGLLAAMLVLAGCSWSPITDLWGDDEESQEASQEKSQEESQNDSNPSLWKDIKGLWGGDEEQAAEEPGVATEESTEAAKDVPGAAGAYPNLSSVPGRDKAGQSHKLERASLAAGLVADRANARYSDQIVRRDGAKARARMAAAEPPPTLGSGGERTTALIGTRSKADAPSPPAVPPTSVASAPIGSAPPAGSETTSIGSATPPPPPAPPVSGPGSPGATATVAALTAPPPAPPSMTAPATPMPRSQVASVVAAPIPPRAASYPATPMPRSQVASVVAAPIPPRAASYPAIPVRRPLAGTVLAGYGAAPAAMPAAVNSEQVGAILFGHGSTRLAKGDKHLLTQIAALQRQRNGVLRVVGHASSRTGETNSVRHQMINFEISLKRANTVAAELRRLGVSAQAIVVEAKSNSEPKFHEWMPSGEAGNRRADVFIDY